MEIFDFCMDWALKSLSSSGFGVKVFHVCMDWAWISLVFNGVGVIIYDLLWIGGGNLWFLQHLLWESVISH